MKKVKQISVALENKPGSLADFCECLAHSKVNVLAISVAETADMGVVRFVVDKPAVAVKMLKECCPLTYTTEDVLLVDMANRPGVLAAAAKKLARAKVNIKYIYGTTGRPGTKSNVVIGASSIPRAARALRRR